MRNKVSILFLAGIIIAVLAGSVFATAIVPSQVAVNPAGTYLVYGTQTSSPTVKIVNITTPASPSTSRTITVPQSVYGVAFTTDGSRALFSINNGTIGVLDFSSGSAPSSYTTITLPSGAEPRNIAVNEDYAFVAANNGYVYILDVSNPADIHYESSISTGYSGLYGAAIKPDGTRLAVSRGSDPGYIYVYDLSDLYRGGTLSSSDLVATISTSSLSSGSLTEPTYLFYGEGTATAISGVFSKTSSDKIFLYVKNHIESSDEADVLVFDSANDSYDYAGKVNLAAYNDFERDFTDDGATDTADPLGGYTGFALSANRQYGYIAIYNDTTSTQQIYRFENNVSSTGSSSKSSGPGSSSGPSFPGSGPGGSGSSITYMISNLVCDTTYPADSIAAETNGRTLWFGYSTVGGYTKYDESSATTEATGFSQYCPSAPTVTYPSTDAYVLNTESLSWEAGDDVGRFSILTYDLDYIQAENIQTNNWQDWAEGVRLTHHSLSDLTVGNSYYVRIRAYDGTDYSAFVYAGPFTVTQESDGLGEDGVWQMIDDFDNHTVVWADGGYSGGSEFSGMYGNMNDIDSDGDQEWSVSNYQSYGSNGYWSGTLTSAYSPMDISSYDALAIEVMGDGSTNTFQIQLVDESGDVWELPSKLSLASTAWQTMEVSRSGMYNITNAETLDFAGKITGYRVKYSSSEAATSGPHYFDNLRAINTQSESIPGPTVDLTVLLQGYYSGGVQAPAAVEIEVRSAADAASATSATVVGTYSNVSLESTGSVATKLSYLPEGDYFVVIRQVIAGQTYYGSNHLPIMSANKISLIDDGTPKTINFSDGLTTAAYGTDALYQDGSVYLMRAGDANGDGTINTSDFIVWALATGSVSGSANWLPDADFDGNGAINSSDFILWALNSGKVAQLPAE